MVFSALSLITGHQGKEDACPSCDPDELLCCARSMESIRQCGVALCIVLGFSILSASIGSSVVRDRVTGAKRLQHISGLGYRTYWLANFLYDMVGTGNGVLRACMPGLCACVKRPPPQTVHRRTGHCVGKSGSGPVSICHLGRMAS